MLVVGVENFSASFKIYLLHATVNNIIHFISLFNLNVSFI